jgi:uncharacterized protein (DUF427 family)
VPILGPVRVTHEGLLLAESSRGVGVEQSNHVDQIYVAGSDVRWDLFKGR